MKIILLSLFMLSQTVFLNASETVFNGASQIDLAQVAKFNRDLYTKNIPALTATLQQAIEENEKSGGIYTSGFSRFNITENGNNILHIAALGASVELTRLALQVGILVDSEQLYRNCRTSLHFVAGDSWSHIVIEKPHHDHLSRLAIANLLLDAKADVNKRDSDGHSPLIYAILANNSDLINLFLSRGAKVNFDDQDDDDQPLYRACCHNNLPIVRLLLEHGANPFCVVNKRYPVSRIRIDKQAQKTHKEIEAVVASYAKNLIPCSRERSTWEKVVGKLS